MRFRLLFVSSDYVATRSETYLVPGTPDFQVQLKKHQLDDLPPEKTIRGKVTDSKGKPIKNAMVSPKSLRIGKNYGDLDGVDPLAVTNDKGEFRIGLTDSGQLEVLVSSHGFAKRTFMNLKPAKDNSLELEEGAVVQGTVLANGKPLAGIGMGLVQQDRTSDNWLGSAEISTDKNGFFQFVNVATKEKYYLYGIMNSLKKHGCIEVFEIEIGKDESVHEIKSIKVKKGCDFRGQVKFSDGKAIPNGLRISISGQKAWDNQQYVVDSDGTFEFSGLPKEEYTLYVGASGYRLSRKNANLSPLNPTRLIGVVTQGHPPVEVLLEPGKPHSRKGEWQAIVDRWEEIRARPIRGAESGVITGK